MKTNKKKLGAILGAGVIGLVGYGVYASSLTVNDNSANAVGTGTVASGCDATVTTTAGAITWSDIVAIEARYVPGLRKRGTNDERNVVAAWVLTRGQEPVKLPRELGLRELAALLALIAERSGAPVNKVLVANLMQR